MQDRRPHSAADPAARAQAERANQNAALARDTAFRAEQADARWSGSTAAALRQVLTTPGDAAGAVRAVDCRTTTCRVELVPGAAGDMNEFLAQVASRMTSAVGAMV